MCEGVKEERLREPKGKRVTRGEDGAKEEERERAGQVVERSGFYLCGRTPAGGSIASAFPQGKTELRNSRARRITRR